MNQIKIEEIGLINFKGIRSLTVRFSDLTEISGDNGLGKTTIADAIWWLLFEKDSKGREDFDIKTLDSDGNVIERLPHEVSGTLTVNGATITLTKKYNEKWVKKAGREEFRGHEIERYFNEVPCTKKEYNAKIAEICNEQDFKYLTNPFFFCAQKQELQKAKLLEMAGAISDEDIAKENKDFEHLLSLLSDTKTLEDLKKEIKSKKSRINEDIKGIPDRIDEQKRTMPSAQDWESLEKELSEKESALEDIEGQIMDIAKRNEAQDNALKQIYEEINNLREKISDRETAIFNEVNKGFFAEQDKWLNLQQKALILKTDIAKSDSMVKDTEKEIVELTARREVLIAEYKTLAEQRKAINAQTITFDESQFVCPTCHQTLDADGIEARRMELISNFNALKDKNLALIAKKIEENAKKGALCSQTVINEKKLLLEELRKEHDCFCAEREAIVSLPEYAHEPKKTDVTPLVATDSVIMGLKAEIDSLQKKSRSTSAKTDFSDLSEKRTSLKSAINFIRHNLDKKGQYEKAINRIDELEGQYSVLAEKLEEQDRLEKIITDFNKAKNEEIARRINHLFSLVRFRWISLQVNGGEKETCEVTVDGVPYASLNHAKKINAGLDIINAISRHIGIAAPVIIDNAESVNEYLATDSQKILLRVTKDKELTINNK